METKNFLGNTSICPMIEPYNWPPCSYRTDPIDRASESGVIVSLTERKEIDGLICSRLKNEIFVDQLIFINRPLNFL